ncbi:MAG TPA: hypothetical protein VHB77_10485, partial [Planctomycetaceae bacterium]|nr:hypothetical protein [Planctomycetaceae bacterium]
HSLLGFFGLLLTASAAWMHHSADADPTAVLLIWAVVATAALPLRQWLDSAARRNNRTDPLATALHIGIPLVLFGVTTCGLAFIAWPARLGALIALAGVWHLAQRSESPAYRAAFVGLFNGNLLTTVVAAMASSGPYITSVTGAEMAHISLALAAVTALELFVIEWSVIRRWLLHDMLAHAQTVVLWALLVALLMCPLQQLHAGLTLSQAAFAALAFVLGSAKLISYSYRSQRTEGTWGGLLMLVAGGCYFAAFGLLDVRTEWALYVPLVASCVLWTVGRMLSNRTGMQVIAAPLQHTARWLPLLVPAIAVSRHVVDPLPVWRGSSSLALFASAGFYFWVGIETHCKRYVLLASAIVNIALGLLWRELGWHDPQLFMVPMGASLLLVVEWLKPEIPAPYRDPLRYVGALVILVSPTFDILGGSWLHLCSLMVLSVIVALVAMGLRVRALLYTGTAFLAADIVAMVVRGGIDRPNLLWITGMLLGGGIVALAAFCENHREALLARVRAVAATLEAWE